MPLGLYTSCEVSAPCGLCSTQGVIGLLDVPDTFLDPGRMGAGLIWFTRGYVEYQFPNNSKLMNGELASIEFAMELSSEVPGTAGQPHVTIAGGGHFLQEDRGPELAGVVASFIDATPEARSR